MFDDLVAWAEIDLDALAANVCAIQHHVGERVEMIAVLKANAYGHGAVPLAPFVLRAGATRIAVHRAIEGIELRQAGIQAPILVLGYIPPAAAGLCLQWQLTPTVNTLEFGRALSSQAAAAGIILPIHIKIDTGLSRFGLLPAEAIDFACALKALPGLHLEGLFTHFATSDAADQTHVREQLRIFQTVIASMKQAGIEFPVIHAANSGAVLHLTDAHFTAVRPGITMFGMPPSREWDPPFGLQPILTLKSRIARVRDLPAGTAVGYGRTYIAQKPVRVGLVQVGYGDGFHRLLSSQGSVLVHGKRAPIIGRISMDQFVIDVTDIPVVQPDDEVVVIGRQGEEEITADEIARLAGTINYEVTTSLLPRVTRIYMQGGQEVMRVGLGEF